MMRPGSNRGGRDITTRSRSFPSVSERSTKRQRFLSLTPKGVRTLADSLPAWREAHHRFVQSIGGDYWTTFRSELEKFAQIAAALEHSPIRATLASAEAG